MKNVLLAAIKLCGYAGKRSGQVIEALDLGIGKRDVVQDETYLLPGIEACRKLNTVSQAKLNLRREFDLILFAAVREVAEGELATECLVPVHILNQLLDLFRRTAGRIETANQASHAGAGHQVYRHVVLVEPFQYANMG
jgi:hypothetical protein